MSEIGTVSGSSFAVDSAGYAKIEDLWLAGFIGEYVAGLEVALNDLALMCVVYDINCSNAIPLMKVALDKAERLSDRIGVVPQRHVFRISASGALHLTVLAVPNSIENNFCKK